MNIPEETVSKVAKWLRKGSNMETGEGLLQRRRVDYFCGEDIKAALMSDKFEHRKFFPKELGDREIDELGSEMMRQKLFFRGVITNLDTVDLEELDTVEPHRRQVFIDEPEEVYVWIMPQSRTELYLKCAGMLVSILFMCMIKIWPLWLKIGVWWVSLIMLICMTSLIVVRLVLTVLCTIVGFRGIWLLPNLLNDDIDFLDAFSPLFGRGINLRAYQQAQLERLAARRRRRGGEDKKKKDDLTEDEQAELEKEGEKEDPVMTQAETFRVGLINISVIFILGIVLCNYFGLFMPDNIPDFVVSQVELWKEFPSLAPPDFDAEVHAAEEAAKAKHPADVSLEDLLKEEDDGDMEGEYIPDPILDRVDDDEGEFADLDLPDVPDDEES